MDARDFRQELRELINGHSLENESNTPDFVLANLLVRCLEAFDEAVVARLNHHYLKGRSCDSLTPSEALFGFAGWITTRKEQVVASSKDDAAVWARLIDEFCKANKLPEPRDNQPDFVMPSTDTERGGDA